MLTQLSYLAYTLVCLVIGLVNENALMCCAAALFAIAAEIAASHRKKG